MPLDTPTKPGADDIAGTAAEDDARLHDQLAQLNAKLRHHGATDVLRHAVAEFPDLALVSSFGAESVALLHLTAMVDRNVPVIFIDTQMLFPETLVYQQEVAERLGLRDLRIVTAANPAQGDPTGLLHQSDPDACCELRKTRPLARALEGHGGWITGRKRFQSGARAALNFFEVESGSRRIKVNPLAHWRSGDVADYIAENRLPRHPLVARGYPSIGCAPCTSPVQKGEDPRAGRWRHSTKEECGIHFIDGKMIRTGANK